MHKAGYYPVDIGYKFKDDLSRYPQKVFADGVRCDCSARIYKNRGAFKTHCSTKRHQKWLNSLIEKRDCIVNQLFLDNENAVNIPPPPIEVPVQNDEIPNIPKEAIQCIICMEALDERALALPCAHTFHDSCIEKWLKKKNECPICKSVV